MKSVRSCIGTLVVLVLFRVGEIAEACSCSPVHPQQAFCNADVAHKYRFSTGAGAGACPRAHPVSTDRGQNPPRDRKRLYSLAKAA